uniref:transposase n=1 Tax=Photorhabdus heterorhabditis TaxID=880156 RepID=UPI001C25A117
DKYVDFSALADTIDRVAPRIISPKGGRPPFPTEVMVRIIILKHFHNLSDEKMEYQLLDRMSWQRFCRLTDVINIPDRNTIWCFEKRIGQEGASALFEEAKHQLSAQGFIPRGGQIIGATLLPVPKQHNKKEENEQIRQGKMPDNWTANKRCQKGRNKKIAKTRARAEHIFGSFSQMGEKFIRTIGQLRANFAMMMKATCYDLQRLVYFGKSGIHAF